MCTRLQAGRWIGLAWGSMVLASTPATAQEVTKLDVQDQAAPTFTVYTEEDGLSEEIWNTIGFDRRGFVWAGSASELARFDGYRWTRWPFLGARSLVKDLEIDARGVLWAAFEREGLARYAGKEWSLVGGVPGPHRGFWVTGLNGSRTERTLWETGSGIWRLRGDRWEEVESPRPSEIGTPVAIAETRTLFGGPRRWIGGADGGLWYQNLDDRGEPRTGWLPFEDPEVFAFPNIDLLRNVHRGREELWALSYGHGVIRLREEGHRRFRVATGDLPTEALYQATSTVDRDGVSTVWISSRAGLIRVRDDDVTVFDQRHGLPSSAVRRVVVQRDVGGVDVLWVATEGGIARAILRESEWQTVSLLGSRSNGTFGVLVEPDDAGGERLWVGSAMEGLGLLEKGKWRHFRLEDGTLPARGVRAIFRLPRADGRPWRLVALIGGGLLEIGEGSRFVPIEVPWPRASDQAATFALARRSGGELEHWFATSHDGIHLRVDGEWTRYWAEGAQVPWSVWNLVEQTDGEGRSWLWAATSHGLARFDGEMWEMVADVPGFPGGGLRHVNLIPEGGDPVLWIGTNRHGIVRLDVSRPDSPQVLGGLGPPPPPDPTVYSVLADNLGQLWVCTNNGVQRLTRNPDGSWRERVYRRSDGLAHDECNTNAQLVDSHDRYWLGTLGGLSVHEPRTERIDPTSRRRPLYFTGLGIDAVSREIPDDRVVVVPSGTREVRVSFSLLTGLRERESTYSSQLVGYEPTPVAWTTERSRRFTGLPPGTFRLVVEGRDWSGRVSAPIELTLEIEPEWWERRLVQGLGGVALLLLSVGGVLLHNRRLRRRQRELEREVALRTEELRSANDQLTELSYRDPLTGVANRRRLLEVMGMEMARAVELGRPIGVVVSDVDHFKAYNDRWGHLVGDVALRAVARALELSCRERDLVARFGGEEFVCLLVDVDAETVTSLAERMRLRVEELSPRALGNDHQGLTISLGTVVRVPTTDEEPSDLLGAADVALYEAKRAGRNCVRGAAD